MLTKQRAIEIATADNRGVLGTWVEAVLHDHHWVILGVSKSARPPRAMIVDARDGRVVLKRNNTGEESWEGIAENSPNGPVLRLHPEFQLGLVGIKNWSASDIKRKVKVFGFLRILDSPPTGKRAALELKPIEPLPTTPK